MLSGISLPDDAIYRILFIVDYPMESNQKTVQFIESVSISQHDREKICHLNAEKLLSV